MQLFLIHNFVPSQKLPAHWDNGENGGRFCAHVVSLTLASRVGLMR
jgi:hypothetical protein